MRRLRSIFLAGRALTAAVLALSCNTKRVADAEERTPRPLCPDCAGVDSAGGETTDFSGSRVECCDATRSTTSLDDPRALALGAERYAGWIEAGYEGPFQWRRSWGATFASGYDAQTRLTLTANVDGLEYVDQERSLTPSNPYICPSIPCDDYLEFVLHVELATADGALSGGGELHARSLSTGWLRSYGSLPITEFTGTLALGTEERPPRVGAIGASVSFSEHGVEGQVLPWIRESSEGGRSSELMGTFPTPACSGVVSGPMLTVDAVIPVAGGATVSELFESLIVPMEAKWSMPARWLDGTATELTATIVGGVEQACGEYPRIGFWAPLHVQTADGRLDMTQRAISLVSWNNLGQPEILGWFVETEVSSSESLKAALGYSGILPEGLELMAKGSGSAAGGQLSITGRDKSIAPERLFWCASGDCLPDSLP
jgi:hypothetical protein